MLQTKSTGRSACATKCLCYDFGVASLGVYIQVPFCQTKCTYCNFHTGVVSAARFAPYVDAVCTEIAQRRALYANAGIETPNALTDAVVDSVYIGGGTPSLLDPAHLARMMDSIRSAFANDIREATLEADPETISAGKAAAWVAAA